MARNGPAGQPATRAPTRRSPADQEQYPVGQPVWPPAPVGQHFDPHAQDGYGQAASYGAQQGHPQQHSQGYYFPQETEPDYRYAGQPGGHFQSAPSSGHAHASPPPQWGTPAQHESSHYDLGSYMPMNGEPRGYAQAEPHFQNSPDSPFRHQHASGHEHGYAETEADYDEVLDEEELEPRRGRRGLVIAGALVGAIGLGGAMAYTYKTFIATPTRAPVVKVTDAGPNKIRPALPGGREFAHTDKKLLNRIDDEGGPQRPSANNAAADDRPSEDPNAPRRVRSIPITPAGQMPLTTASAPAAPMVPGITLDNIGPPAGPPPAARVQIPSAPPPAMAARAAAPSPPPPVKIVSAPQPPPADPPEVAPAPKKAVVAAVAPPSKQPVPKAAAPVVTASAATSGYVAVLSSRKSRMDALKAFADLQQKYGDVLSSKTPDVQEANLGDKGIWYRAVVGPPVSREAASGVCSQLKNAGYVGCWVTAY